jgi:NADPH:quinone reductase-like Zn-dependent oxidoreductase
MWRKRVKAITVTKYGPPDVLKLEEIDKPVVPDDGVLVRVHASSVNILDLYSLTRMAYIARMLTGHLKPKREVLGTDFSGTVESVGKRVTQFQPGDDVFGSRRGAFAEYVCVREDGAVVRKPANVTFEQAAAVPVAAITARQAVRDHGQIRPGQKVLINGASGGVGTFAVQIAKSFRAEVTGVCGTRNVDLVRSIGADRVIDYTHEDFTRSGQRYDVMLDIAGNRAWSECRRVLNPKATFVAVGTRTLGHLVTVRLASVGGSRKVVLFIAKMNKADLVVLQDLLEAGRVTPVIDRQYELSEVPEALRYLGERHANGKIVITVDHNDKT